MGQCISGPEPAGQADSGKPNAKKIVVILSTGMEVPVFVLPTDTMERVSQKVEDVHGRQPDVSVKGSLVRPMLNARHEKKWIPVRWDATIAEIGQDKLKYSDITDILKKVKIASHVHWAVSNAVALS